MEKPNRLSPPKNNRAAIASKVEIDVAMVRSRVCVVEMLMFSISVSLAQDTEVLTNPVEYHDGVVQRVTDDRQHRRQYRQVEGDLEERQDTDGHDHVVNQRNDGADRELPLKAESQVDQDAAERHQHAEAALVAQLFTDLRADELDTLDRCRVVAADLLQRLGDLVTQLRVFTWHTHQQIGSCTEALHDGFVVTRRQPAASRTLVTSAGRS